MSDPGGHHVERDDGWPEQDALKRRIDHRASVIMWSVLAACGLAALWWW